jgi:hypothetical protein
MPLLVTVVAKLGEESFASIYLKLAKVCPNFLFAYFCSTE